MSNESQHHRTELGMPSLTRLTTHVGADELSAEKALANGGVTAYLKHIEACQELENAGRPTLNAPPEEPVSPHLLPKVHTDATPRPVHSLATIGRELFQEALSHQYKV